MKVEMNWSWFDEKGERAAHGSIWQLRMMYTNPTKIVTLDLDMIVPIYVRSVAEFP